MDDDVAPVAVNATVNPPVDPELPTSSKVAASAPPNIFLTVTAYCLLMYTGVPSLVLDATTARFSTPQDDENTVAPDSPVGTHANS